MLIEAVCPPLVRPNQWKTSPPKSTISSGLPQPDVPPFRLAIAIILILNPPFLLDINYLCLPQYYNSLFSKKLCIYLSFIYCPLILPLSSGWTWCLGNDITFRHFFMIKGWWERAEMGIQMLWMFLSENICILCSNTFISFVSVHLVQLHKSFSYLICPLLAIFTNVNVGGENIKNISLEVLLILPKMKFCGRN